MPGPDPMPAGVPTAPRGALGLFSDGPAWWALVVVTSVVTAWLTFGSVQQGCTAALLVLTVGLYVQNRTAGLVAVWLLWLLAPFVRRVFLLSQQVVGAEPLALAPFLVTAVIVTLELQRVTLSRRARRILLLVAGGYAIGIPMGFLTSPPAAAFALFAYIGAAGCFVIGYREAEPERPLVLPGVLMAAVPFLALYGFWQYFVAPLPEWDHVWQEETRFITGGSPEEGRIRVWSTLNSPGTFSIVLVAAGLCLLTLRRVSPFALAGGLAVFGALALTYVRSSWIGLFVALIAIVLVTRGAALQRVAPIVLILAALGPVALGGSTEIALGERFQTLGAVEGDTSAGHRSGTAFALVPYALSLPLGTGIGSAGEATRLAGGGFRFTDNGYLALLYQAGPFGFMLVMAAFVAVVRSARRNAWRLRGGVDVLAFAIVVFTLVTMLAGDVLYGAGGVIFWYACGLAVRRGELAEESST